MKSWHIVVMEGHKLIKDVEKFNTKEANELFDKLKKEYKETNPTYVVKREWY